MSDSVVLATFPWRTNGHMIADVAKLGYLDGDVLDLTYGEGVFWSQYRPDSLVASDIDIEKSPYGESVDFTGPYPWPDEFFDAVVLDPPYRLNGRPDPTFDKRYGTHERTRWQDRMDLIRRGIWNCRWLIKINGYLLLKCQDQVCSGHKRWQTDYFTEEAAKVSLKKVDRFDMVTPPRPQPEGRSQCHSHGNTSTLLVFERTS